MRIYCSDKVIARWLLSNPIESEVYKYIEVVAGHGSRMWRWVPDAKIVAADWLIGPIIDRDK